MLSNIARLGRKSILLASRLVYPPARRRISQVRIDGRELLILANEDVGRQILLFRTYEARETAFLRRNVLPGDVCLDVGANTGYFTTLLAKHARQGEVHAFEPVSLSWHLLNASVLVNGYRNVHLHNLALGATPGTASFSSSTDTAYSSFLPTGRYPEKASLTITVETLDGFVAQHGLQKIDVLKVDVEGAEGLVVAGARELLSSEARRPRIVMLELYDANHRPYGTTAGEIMRAMQGHGYRAHVVQTGGLLRPFVASDLNVIYNIIFLPSSARTSGSST